MQVMTIILRKETDMAETFTIWQHPKKESAITWILTMLGLMVVPAIGSLINMYCLMVLSYRIIYISL